jgi:hypothetical protein
MYYVKFDDGGYQEQVVFAEELPGEEWHPAGEDINNKFFHLVNGLPVVMTDEEREQHMFELRKKSTIRIARDRRNRALIESDWTQLASSPLSESKKAEWEAYRQELRDYPDLLESNLDAPFPAQPQ